jgi:uncharacterized protein (DUF2141 family)
MASKLKMVILFLIFSMHLTAQSITVNITGIRNNKGVLRLAFYMDEESFNKDTPLYEKIFSKENIKSKTFSVEFLDIPKGVYGIAVLDDENNNGKMNYSFFGLPKEGFGFSNYYHTGMKRPKFNDFKFHFKEDLIVEIVIRYF